MDFSLPELIRLNIPFIIILVLLLITGSIAYWLYRTTTPPVQDFRKMIMGILRASVLFLTVLLFFTPTLKLTYINSKPLRTGIFIDNSGSMSIRNSFEDRKKTVDSVIVRLKKLVNDQDISWYTFNQTTRLLTDDTVVVTGASTNFEDMLLTLEKAQTDQNVLITDGVITDGKINIDNRLSFGKKIHVIGIGSEKTQKDILISNVLYPPTAYLNERQELEVQIANSGVSGVKTMLRFYQNGNLIDSKMLDIGTRDAEQTALFSWIPGKPGLQSLTLELDGIDGESNRLNNKFVFAQEILKSKIRIAVFGGVPGYESKFIALLLNSNKDYLVESFVEDKKGRFLAHPNTAFLDSVDVVVFEGFPGPSTRFPETNGLMTLLKRQRPGVILFLNSATDWQAAKSLDGILPRMNVARERISGEFAVRLPNTVQIHPVLQVFAEPERTKLFWSKIPPLQSSSIIRDFTDAHSVLAEGIRANQRIPVIIAVANDYGRSLVFNGDAFWKWHFLLQNDPMISQGYTALLSHSVRWIAHDNESKPVVIRSNAKVLKYGEKFLINGNLFDAEQRPVRDGTLTIEAEWEDQRFMIDAVHDSLGNYNAEFWPPGAGTYKITARGERGGLLLGEDSMELQVIPFQKEFIRTEQNSEFLKNIASQSGGTYVTKDDLDKLTPLLQAGNRYIRNDEEVEVWYKPMLLFVILLLVTAEWIIRKRSGLA